MPTGDFPPPEGHIWTDANGWIKLGQTSPMFPQSQMGCICPGDATPYCRNPMCPRRNPFERMTAESWVHLPDGSKITLAEDLARRDRPPHKKAGAIVYGSAPVD